MREAAGAASPPDQSSGQPSGLLPEQRRSRILAILGSQELARPGELAAELQVSLETVRRDLLALEQEGRLRRVYGAATLTGDRRRTSEPARDERSRLVREAKEEIARTAAGLVTAQDTVFLDVGTTAEAVARHLPADFRGLVVTNNVMVVLALRDRPEIGLHLLGGKVRHDEVSCSGSDTVRGLAQFNADVAFLGSGGISATRGLTDYDADEITVRAVMLANATRGFVLADSTKLGRVATRRVCGIEALAGVLTDSAADPAQVTELRDAGLPVLLPD
ncbi:MAG: DeoR family transcriptional regulator, fructose operon transcriptional repressor [Nocardioidaceae bacterium]|nr:DeoR family transcriptional regulator, fructose operon transcriptional repressor [Nocardioidaceae bacterium]